MKLINIDPKALEHACQCAGRAVHHFDRMALDLPLRASIIAHARAIEQHETDIADLQAEYDEVCKLFEAFRQEVSDAVESRWMNILAMKCEDVFSRFIIAKPDPLVEAINSAPYLASAKETADHIRAALAARGLEIREKQP